MKIAVEGCGHGELDKIYETIAFVEKQDNIKVDLLLCCGDFQAVRNRSDLQAMAVPPKYQKMNTFYKYYSGEKTAPVLTVFIGGNHEASNYLQELPYGGWVAPNIYYLGYAGVLKFGGIRIGGLSGIYKGHDYNKGHFERPPYCESSKRSAYHIRNLEVFRLKQISRPIDIFLSHDWPCGIHKYGDVNSLLRRKKHFQEDVKKDELGSPPAMELLHKLQPTHWFSAHLHVKFAAIVEHQSENTPKKTTKFLALDKCLPRRRFLQVIDIPHEGAPPTTLELDPEWLVILKSTNHLLNVTKSNRYMPGPGSSDRWDFTVTEEKMEEIQRDFGGELSIPENFEQTAEVHHPAPSVHYRLPPAMPPQMCINPQTTLICEMLDLVNPFSVFSGQKGKLDLDLNITVGDSADNVSFDEGTYDDDPSYEDDGNRTYLDSTNPDEISLDDIGEDSDVGSPLATELSRGKLQLPECTSDQSTSSVNLYNLSMNMSTDKDEKTDAEGAGEESTTNNSVSSCTDLDKSQEADITTSTPAKEGPSSSKKFKRRNQSMYASDQS